MDLHTRYLQQAAWTRDLRTYAFEQAGLTRARSVLEVGCGTGVILAELNTSSIVHGLDIDRDALTQARVHAPKSHFLQGDALHLPFPNRSIDITYCHFLLLWVGNPLAALIEMKRVTRPGGYVLALAEPDYTARIDQPADLAILGTLQAESLRRRGADVSLGARLADLMDRAGIQIEETGALQPREPGEIDLDEWEKEWAMLESDLDGQLSSTELIRLRTLDQEARARGERELHVPTYFAWGKV